MSALLLAEDDEDIAAVLVRIFRRTDLTVVRAVNGAAALELAIDGNPDVVLTDIGMPTLDGWGLITAIRQHPVLSDTPIAVLSGHLMPGDPDAATSGACAILLKPCPKQQLLDTVHQLIALGRHGHSTPTADCLALHLVHS
jgi:CheY-like chemotaxis protein